MFSLLYEILLLQGFQFSFIGTADTLRNGQRTDTQAYKRPQSLTETQAQTTARKNNAVQQEEVLQEPWEWYDKCFVRERNRGREDNSRKICK